MPAPCTSLGEVPHCKCQLESPERCKVHGQSDILQPPTPQLTQWCHGVSVQPLPHPDHLSCWCAAILVHMVLEELGYPCGWAARPSYKTEAPGIEAQLPV